MARSVARSVQRRFGEKIQALRHDRELTQDALAHRCGLSQKYLSELERGEKTPSWETLVALAHKGFQIRLAALVFGIDEEIETEARELEDLPAGRSQEVRYDACFEPSGCCLRAGEGFEIRSVVEDRLEDSCLAPTIDSEVRVQRQDLASPKLVCEVNEAGVGQIHRHPRVFLEQRLHASGAGPIAGTGSRRFQLRRSRSPPPWHPEDAVQASTLPR